MSRIETVTKEYPEYTERPEVKGVDITLHQPDQPEISRKVVTLKSFFHRSIRVSSFDTSLWSYSFPVRDETSFGKSETTET